MTIVKAIEALERNGAFGNPVILEAQRLGIEALKRIKLHREVHYKDAIFRLPGETIVDSLSLTEGEK